MHTVLLIAACFWVTCIVLGVIVCGLILLDQWRQNRGYPSFGMIAPDPYDVPSIHFAVPSPESISAEFALHYQEENPC